MVKETNNIERKLSSRASSYERMYAIIGHKEGLHMRPASFVNRHILQKYSGCKAYIRDGKDPAFGGVEIDGKLYADFRSIMNVLSLGVPYGHKVEIVTKGKEAKKAAEEICAFLSSDLSKL